jgi:ferritin
MAKVLVGAEGKTAADLDELDSRQTDFISEKLEGLLNDQVSYEMYSAYLYFMVAAWCQSKGLTGFERWFKKQGDDEIVHAMKVYKHLVDTGSSVTLPAIPSPVGVVKFATMADATRAVLDHEMTVTKKWQVIGEMVKKESNLATQNLAQWFAVEQVEEEDAAVTLHQKVQLAEGGAGLLVIDAELRGVGPV